VHRLPRTFRFPWLVPRRDTNGSDAPFEIPSLAVRALCALTASESSQTDSLCLNGFCVVKPNVAAPGSSGVVPDADVAPVPGQPVLVSRPDDVARANSSSGWHAADSKTAMIHPSFPPLQVISSRQSRHRWLISRYAPDFTRVASSGPEQEFPSQRQYPMLDSLVPTILATTPI
jgi:hypothetical protein